MESEEDSSKIDYWINFGKRDGEEKLNRFAPVAQWIEQQPSKLSVIGSTPIWCTKLNNND